MAETLQIIKDLGIPFGVLVVGLVVLWRENRRLQGKLEDLYDRLTKRPSDGYTDEQLQALVAGTAKVHEDVRRILARCRTRSCGTADTTDQADPADEAKSQKPKAKSQSVETGGATA